MDYYTEIGFFSESVILKSFKQKPYALPVLMEECVFPAGGAVLKLKSFPKNLIR